MVLNQSLMQWASGGRGKSEVVVYFPIDQVTTTGRSFPVNFFA